MLKIGVTGGIGSGKSTVCSIFNELGIPIYSADDRAKELMVESESLRSQIKAIFGEKAYSESGLNREHIASLAFQDPELLGALNQAVHPAVIDDFKVWSEKMEISGYPYVIKEAALMFESGSYKDLDAVITVSAPEELRIERSIKRDGVTREKITERISKQWSEEQRLQKADHVIQNDGESALIPQVLELHRQLLNASKD